ncbi:MAG: NAD-dependent epimerase/dehydratase family protein, partial [Candidatus Diapherotrites archaeon]|nr:NAD-dependent epimerase/dehydratase family protein [Candidatus Diapherotrites archaeon]
MGGWLCKGLLEKGASITATVHGGTESLKLQGMESRLSIESLDIRDSGALKEVFLEKKPEICFHLAAVSSTKTAMQNLFETVDTNVISTVKVLEAARNSGAAVCFASSVKAYGGTTKKGFRESRPLNGTSFGLNAAIARLGNVYGWGDFKFERLVPGAIRSALLGESLCVNGTGESKFDFVFVGDVANGLIAIGEKMLAKGMDAEPFNIGTGKARSVKEVAEEIIRLAGSNAGIKFRGEEKPGCEILSTAKSAKKLGWKAEYSL